MNQYNLLASLVTKNGLSIDYFFIDELTDEQREVLGKLGSLQLPKNMVEKVNRILASDPDDYLEFIDDLNEIYSISNTYTWKIINYIHNLKETIYTSFKTYSTFEIFIFVVTLIILIILEKNFKIIKVISNLILFLIKKIIKVVPTIPRFCLYSLICSSVYLYPVITVYVTYFPILILDG
jgi:hypothetical protein